MRPISTDVAWSECTSVCLLITAMSPTKSDETKWVSFENHVLCRSRDVSERGWHKQHTQRYSQDGSSDTASDYQYRSILYYIQMQLLPLFVWPGRVMVRMSDSRFKGRWFNSPSCSFLITTLGKLFNVYTHALKSINWYQSKSDDAALLGDTRKGVYSTWLNRGQQDLTLRRILTRRQHRTGDEVWCLRLTCLILIKSRRRLYVTRAGNLPPPQTRVPRKLSSRTSARRTYLNTNQGVVSAITVFRGGSRCRGDKCQITDGVSAYACAEIR